MLDVPIKKHCTYLDMTVEEKADQAMQLHQNMRCALPNQIDGEDHFTVTLRLLASELC